MIIRGDATRIPLPDCSVDAIVTDPPYGLGFMGQKWDTYANENGRKPSAKAAFDHVGGNHNPTSSADAARTRRVEAQRLQEWTELWAAECLRVLRPGGHLLAFGGTRTYHRMTCAIEDAGFEVRDCLAWLYGSGFPKSLDVSKALDKMAGAEREVVGDKLDRPGYHLHEGHGGVFGDGDGLHAPGSDARARAAQVTAPATPEAEQWQGWGTALKPAHEPIVLARKPLTGTVASNVLRWGTGALNIDGCRVGGSVETWPSTRQQSGGNLYPGLGGKQYDEYTTPTGQAPPGRWPPNVTMDEEAARLLDEQSGERPAGMAVRHRGVHTGGYGGGIGSLPEGTPDLGYGDTGGASRFMYVAKASRRERGFHTCTCETDKLNAWPNGTSQPRDTSEALLTDASALPMTLFGSELMVPSPPATSSTTSTGTSKTTGSRTSSSSPLPSTSASTADASSATVNGGSPVESVDGPSPSLRTTGTSVKRNGPSTASAASVTSEPSSSRSVCESCGLLKGGDASGRGRNDHPT